MPTTPTRSPHCWSNPGLGKHLRGIRKTALIAAPDVAFRNAVTTLKNPAANALDVELPGVDSDIVDVNQIPGVAGLADAHQWADPRQRCFDRKADALSNEPPPRFEHLAPRGNRDLTVQSIRVAGDGVRVENL